MKSVNFKVISGVCGFLMSVSALSSSAAAMSYPTKWHVQNQSGSTINLSCEGETVGAGLIKDLRSLVVRAKSSTTYTWSDWYFNDGLGLNAASWFCRDNATNTVFDRFSTSWGEEVTLVIKKSGSRLTLSKY